MKPLVVCFTAVLMLSCEELVEDGYRTDHAPSDASFSAEALALESGAAGDRISYKLVVNSNHFIQSCVVLATNEGASGSGYDVGAEGFDDPFADHNYGTVKKGIKSFTVKYDYIIPQDINKSRITFKVIDDMGQVSAEVTVKVVPSIKKYADRALYAKSTLFYDAFASIDGLVYPDIKTNYSTVSAENLDVQEKVDIVFYYDEVAKSAVICSPDNNRVNLDLQVENATRFKKLTGISAEDFDSVLPASLVALTEGDSIAYSGSSQIRGLLVGDVIGFTTDLNAIHSLKTGLIRIKGLHPANVDHYEGTVYVMECDIVTQSDQ